LPTKPEPLQKKDLQLYIAGTYFALRLALFAIGAALPIALLVGGHVGSSGRQPDSISGYYHTGMRNLLVGCLVMIGTSLILYRGFGRLENWLLNFGGAGAIGVAFLPMGRDQGATDGPTVFVSPHWHATCALIAFGGIGLTAILCGRYTTVLLPEAVRRKYQITYQVLGAAMIVLPVIVVLAARRNSAWMFWTESAALWVFAAYWLVKTIECRINDADDLAVKGQFVRQPAKEGSPALAS
jgi:hypothetical protein